MALASTGFSLQANQAINNHIQGFSTAFLSTSNPSDMVAFATAIANWDTFTGMNVFRRKHGLRDGLNPLNRVLVHCKSGRQSSQRELASGDGVAVSLSESAQRRDAQFVG